MSIVLRTGSRRRSRGEQGGQVARIERATGRDEVTHHETHRRTNRRAGGDAPGRVLEQRWTPEERLDEPRHARPWRGTDAASRARRRRRHRSGRERWRRSRAAASSAETRARWMPSPVNGSRKPPHRRRAASPARPDASPGDRAARRRPARRSAAARRQRAGSSSVGGMAATIASATDRAPSRASATRHERPSTIPTLTRPPATGAIPT